MLIELGGAVLAFHNATLSDSEESAIVAPPVKAFDGRSRAWW